MCTNSINWINHKSCYVVDKLSSALRYRGFGISQSLSSNNYNNALLGLYIDKQQAGSVNITKLLCDICLLGDDFDARLSDPIYEHYKITAHISNIVNVANLMLLPTEYLDQETIKLSHFIPLRFIDNNQ